MTASLAPRHPWRSHLHHQFQHIQFRSSQGLGDPENTMTSTTTNSPSTGDIDTSLFPSDPDPGLVSEAKAAVLAALDAAPGSVIERACLARTLSKRLTDSEPGACSAFNAALWFLHATDHLSVIHVGTRTVLVGDPLVTPRDEPRARPFLVA